MTQKNRSDLSSEISSNINDNTTGEISAADVRNTLQDVVDSSLNIISDTITSVSTLTSGVWNATSIAAVKGGTGQSAYTLGDTLYSSATNSLSKLAGNTTTTKKFLRQTGTGTSSASPAWDTLAAGDIPNLDAAKVTSGVLTPARLGGGSAVNDSFLQGSGLWTDYYAYTNSLSMIAFGANNTTLNANDVALGYNNDASGINGVIPDVPSVAIGINNEVNDSPSRAMVGSGAGSVGIGNLVVNIDGEGQPTTSFAAGVANNISSFNSFAYGGGLTNDIDNSWQGGIGDDNKLVLDSDAGHVYAVLSGVSYQLDRQSATVAGQALTKTNDTNVTITLGGSATSALVNAASLTLGWSGQLAGFRGGTGVSNSGAFSYGANNISLTTSGTTALILPTSGTVATLSGAETLSNKKLGSLTANGFIKTTGGDGSLSVDTSTYLTAAVTSLSGTANQVIASAASGAITLSLPQNIATTSAVQFGNIGVGASPVSNILGYFSGSVGGSTSADAMYLNATFTSAVTNVGYTFECQPRTQAAAFTMNQCYAFYARGVALGAGSAVTSQAGFFADDGITAATNNRGFQGNIPAGTGRWNLFMSGSAQNSIIGLTALGPDTTVPTALCDVSASSTTRASIRIRSGAAPTAPNDGDMWYDGTNLKFRVGGTTKTVI